MKQSIKIAKRLYDLSIPRVMGIVNITPDSFYSSSRADNEEAVLAHVKQMVEDGLDILDLGGASTRPGAGQVSEKDEIERVTMALGIVRKEYPDLIISLDTYRSEVARIAIENYGVDIINDISGGTMDDKLLPLVAKKGLPYILMHMKGRPDTMQNKPEYQNLIQEILSWFNVMISSLLQIGIKDIIVDPGFGFGKSTDHNYELLRKLSIFDLLGHPILAGISRKSMIWKELDVNPEESLTGTIALNTIALCNGASILRVHDVKEAVETIKVFRKTFKENKHT